MNHLIIEKEKKMSKLANYKIDNYWKSYKSLKLRKQEIKRIFILEINYEKFKKNTGCVPQITIYYL